jgi:hypothetical protein
MFIGPIAASPISKRSLTDQWRSGKPSAKPVSSQLSCAYLVTTARPNARIAPYCDESSDAGVKEMRQQLALSHRFGNIYAGCVMR